jgi:putative transposase
MTFPPKMTMPNQTMASPGRQLELSLSTRGGARKGAGRKPSPGRQGRVAHASRPVLGKHPVHITKRALAAPNLRAQVSFRAIRACLVRCARLSTFRVLHFSVQRDHIHFIVEADDRGCLARGMQRLSSEIARAVNLSVGRRGSLWADRYHRHDLITPRAVKNAIVYVLFNFRKHRPTDATDTLGGLDDRSSAAFFDGWDPRAGPLVREAARTMDPHAPCPVRVPRTWLGARGWRRRGLLRGDEWPARGVTAAPKLALLCHPFRLEQVPSVLGRVLPSVA